MTGRIFEVAFRINGQMSGTFNASMSAAGRAMGALKNQSSEVNAAQRRLDAAWRQSQQAAAQYQAEMSRLTAQYQRGQMSQSQYVSSMSRIQSQMSSATMSASQYRSELNRLNADMTRIQSTQQRLQTSMGNFNSATGRMSNAWGSLSSSVMQVGVAAAPLAGMLTVAADFEAAMSKVGAISGASAEEMSKLTDTAKQLGSTTQFSASQSAEAMSYLAMAGWKTNQIVGAMPGLLNLAAASGEDLATVSDILSDDMTAFGLSAEQAGHVADVFAAASSNANTNVSMLGETFKYAGPVAGSLGYSLEDVSVAAGLMANASIKGSMAGTALRSIMTRLIEPPKDAANAMEALGIQVKNADGTVKPFGQTIKDLREKFSQLSDAEKAQYANWLAGQEAMGGLLAVVNASDEDFAKLSGAINDCDGKAAEMAKTMQNNAKGALTRLKSAMEGISISIGGALLPALADLVDKVGGIAGAFGEWATTHQGIVKMGLAVAGVGASALIAAKSFAVLTSSIEAARAGMQLLRDMRMAESVAGLAPSGGMFGNMFSGISTAFSGVLGQLSTFGSLLVAKITGPFKAMGGIFRTVGGLMAENMITPFMGKISTFFSGLGGRIMPMIMRFIGPLTTMFAPLASMLTGPLTAAFGGVIASFGGLAAAALPIIGIIAAVVAAGAILYSNWDTICNVAEVVYTKIVGYWEQVKERLQPAFDSISQSFDRLGAVFSSFGGSSSVLETVFNTLGSVVTGTFMAAITVVELFVNQFAIAMEVLSTTINEIGVIIQALAEGDWATAWNSMGNIASTFVSGIGKTVANLVGTVFNGIKAIMGFGGEDLAPSTDIFSGIGESIMNAFSGIGGFMSNIGTNVMQYLSNGLQSGINIVVGAAEAVKNGIINHFQNMINFYLSLPEKIIFGLGVIAGAISQLPTVIGNAVNTAGQFLMALPGKIIEMGTQWLTNVSEWLMQTYTAISTGLTQLVTDAVTWLANLPEAIISAGMAFIAAAEMWLSNTYTTVMTWLANIIAEAGAALMNLPTACVEAGAAFVSAAESWASEAYNSIMNWINQLPSAISNVISSAWEGIKATFSSGFNIGVSSVASNAEGGIYQKGAFLTTFAEDGPEAAIPLDKSPRAIGLWQQAGQMLGVMPKVSITDTNAGLSPMSTAQNYSPLNVSITDTNTQGDKVWGFLDALSRMRTVSNNTDNSSSSQSVTISIPVTISGNADSSTIATMQTNIIEEVKRALEEIQNHSRRVSFA